MPQFRKKPVVIEAWKLENAPMPEWLSVAVASGTVVVRSTQFWRSGLDIKTLEGVHYATPGDYIIQGVKGELYPCKPDIFAATYEPVT